MFENPFALIAMLSEARDNAEVLRRADAAAKSLGYEYVLIGAEVRLPMLEPLQHVSSGYPEKWQIRYAEKQYIARDPTIAHCQTSTRPMVWEPGHYGEDSQELLEESRSYGLSHGVSIGVHQSATIKSMVSLARDKPVTRDEPERAVLVDGAMVLAQCIHVAVTTRIVPELIRQLDPRLSPRELECLQHVARGKSTSVISDILNISEPTVAFHLKNAMGKMKVATRLQAVGMGVALGIIT